MDNRNIGISGFRQVLSYSHTIGCAAGFRYALFEAMDSVAIGYAATSRNILSLMLAA
ncbi:hypothetical protein [Paenibacillus sp. FSL H8-0034]|uniref:hypothetical protein n=1 Tax=Paenibacillus sp. FSL H8-0034 TaxID=2954671 RepID=UPI0030FD1DC8